MTTAEIPDVLKVADTATYNSAGYTPTTGTAASYDPTKLNVTKDQTVEGRVEGLIDSGSPLMKQAETRSLQSMNKRGLINSSMAVGAGQAALYDAALPIAQQDATTFSNAARYNADADNSASQVRTNNQQQVNLANMEAQNRSAEYGATAANTANQFNTQQANAQNQFNASESNKILATTMDSANKLALAGIEKDYKTLMQTNQSVSDMYQMTVKSIEAIQTNPDLEADTKTTYITNQMTYLKTYMAMTERLNDLAGLDELINTA